MKRRSNGEGTVRERKDGRWEAIITLQDGSRRSIYAKTQRDVIVRKAEASSARDHGVVAGSGRLTVADYLRDWLTAVAQTVRPRTGVRYEQLVRVHIVPHIGRVPLVKLGPHHVQQLYRVRLDAGSAPMTVRHVHALLHHALKQAQRWGSVTRNVAELVDPPRSPRIEMRTLTEEQVKAMFQAAIGDRLEALYVVAVTTGMRQGELLGLRWADVDLDRASIRVQRSVQRTSAGIIFVEPKTVRSRRQVILTRVAVGSLRRHRVRQAQDRLMAGSAWEDDDLVFANEVGRPLDGTNVLGRGFRPLLKRAGLPAIRFHDLRHTAATLMLQGNVHPKVVSEQLGHSQIGITLDTYSHVTPTMQRESAAVMDALLAAP